MRLVLASAAPPCESASATVLPQTQAGTVISCLTVGEATVTGHDVESVAMSSDNATSVNITFTADGAQRLDDLFARHYGDQVAMVWHSGVIAAVNIDLPSVNGHVSIGDMNLADAQRLVGELGGDPSDVPVPTPDDVESERLFKICQQHVPPGTGPAGVLFTSSLTAGEITELAQAMLGHSIPPWDALPADHLVARCSFGFESLPPNAPTTV
ncbi:MAG: hypothetical protein QOD72_2110, partial [Acidimicrobiaceae bacterium]|nr:hypothetical protein [Acidimicrobiaceae bacterium]